MLNMRREWLQQLKQQLQRCKQVYQDFRIYNLGSSALNYVTPKHGYQAQLNVAYGLKSRQRLDIFRSEQPRAGRPLIVFVHGGAWSQGDKQDYRFVAQAFTQEGYDVVVPNYHLAPTHIFPRSIDDLHIALNYLHAQQQRHQLCTEQIILMGHSAGAFNIMSALYHPAPYQLHCQQNIRAMIGLAGPYHFDYKGDPLCEDAFDQNVPYQQVMPYYFVQSNAIRHYLFVAQQDQVVHLNNSVDLDRALKAVGNHSELVYVPRTGHISVIGSVSAVFSRYFSTKKQILQALEQALL